MFDDFDIDDLLFNEHFSDVLDAFVAKCPLRGARSYAAGAIDIFAD
jgi:hypothetical protein